MAALGISAPNPLSLTGNLAQNFKQFEQSFWIYISASGLDSKSLERQGNVLLHVIGDDALRLYNGFKLDEDKEKDPHHILAHFKQYCTPMSNITYERHLFNSRTQNSEESFDSFYTDLCKLSKNCEYDNLADEMIRDRIVVGILNKDLQQKLFRDSKLTLNSAI